MSETKIKLIPGVRCDGFVSDYTPNGNPIREKWIHKKVPIKIGEGEDDWILEEKAVCIEKANIQKEIEQQAKQTANVKELVKQCIETGDQSCLNIHQLTYGDVSDMPTDLHEAIATVKAAKEKGLNLDDDKILTMTKDEVNALINNAVKSYIESQKPKEEPKQQVENSGGNV